MTMTLRDPHQALSYWQAGTAAIPPDAGVLPIPDAGLINETWLVCDSSGSDSLPVAVLQWLNPIIDPRIHEDVLAVTGRLREFGMATPELIPTAEGRAWLPEDENDPAKGCWRMWTYVPGVTWHRLETPAQAAAAGELVGRFHSAMAGWNYEYRAPRRNIHDTPARMTELRSALAERADHPLIEEAGALGASILDGWRLWSRDGRTDLPARSCHGDLKISNLRFASTPSGTAPSGICLLDLDTLGPQTLAAEMGDAWRSWCNPAGEDEPDRVRFDVHLFAASARAWISRMSDLTLQEAESLVPGIERICWELAARFCTDAIRNSYFRENRKRHPEPGRHNLVRAASQCKLAQLVRAERERCIELIEDLLP
ncbi:MAG: phosphotransferase [Thermoanaerobaculia bacterium]|nr:phosphotransferase [Thermoanaerobaculia bacterium]